MELVVVGSEQVDLATRTLLRRLWDEAFDDFTDEDAEHAYGGVHVIARDADGVVAHASAVPRRIRFGAGPWLTFGYVEGVATVPGRQGEGIGRRVMALLQQEIAARWRVAMLSTGSPAFYERLGWEPWQGPSYTLTADGPVADSEDQGLMVLRIDGTVVTDLSAAVTCEDRLGDAW